ncbi:MULTISPECIES: DUF6509 family protein [Bacillaceae]|uniref:DUF6509 family protein n=1 Tax=Bacillaceae TaxID=186817 RepID=UPI000C787461|nr:MULTISPECIES: DUF6509 family protein [Bacillaceae]PLR69512.1 pullulanase [Bacillus sp. UMB0893]QNG59013.1 pullulanase [Bacillus sp. PAMC26568]
MNITAYTVEKLHDPFGILAGNRYEFFLDLDVDEDDELYTEKGLLLKVIYQVDDSGGRISVYHLMEKESNAFLDFELDEEEEVMIKDFCQEHYLAEN